MVCQPSSCTPSPGMRLWGLSAGRSQAARRAESHRALSSPLGSGGNRDGQRGGKAAVTNKKAVLHTGINWCGLGMRLQSKSPLPEDLYQYNPTQPPALARFCCNLFIFGQTGPTAFRPAHMDWSAQEKTQNKHKQCNTQL